MIRLMTFDHDDEQRQARLKAALRELVERLGSQAAVAEAIGVKQPRISQILARGERVTEKVLFGMARYTGRSVSDLVGETEGSPRMSSGDEEPLPERRPVIDEREHPRLRELDDWRFLLSGAQSRAAERNRAIPEWAWSALANTAPALTVAPTVVDIYELACFYADHGWGRPVLSLHEASRARAQRGVRESFEARGRGVVEPRVTQAHERSVDDSESEADEAPAPNELKSGVRARFEVPQDLFERGESETRSNVTKTG